MTPIARACLALRLLAVDPQLGGIMLRARAGPARDMFCAALDRFDRAQLRLHPTMEPDAIEGGVDVARSLGQGFLVARRGLLDRAPSVLILPMAERTEGYLCAQLAAATDAGRHVLIALDEGAEPDEHPPARLSDPLAFHLILEDVGLAEAQATADVDLSLPTTRLGDITAPEDMIEAVTTLSVDLGIVSLRAPMLALRAAKAHAALAGRLIVTAPDLQAAAELVLAPRATRLPQMQDPEPPLPENASEPTEAETSEANNTPTEAMPQDMLLAAIAAALPPDVLDTGHRVPPPKGGGSGAGTKRVGNRRGRPLPPRAGGGGGTGARVDLFATLRAAIPWQRMRQAQFPDRTGAIVLPSDLRYKRSQDLSDRLLIFAVDASGSSAVSRLAEAKGAVELLLADAYAKRDHVALIAFRGTGAEVLLPPTRSLVQTKRRLADLPGGGGTPLAAGLRAALEAAFAARNKGLAPILVVLTDGRGNVDLNGQPGRPQAAEDANSIAKGIAQAGFEAVLIDTANRPEHSLEALAHGMNGRYVPLPRANAHRLSQAIGDALEA